MNIKKTSIVLIIALLISVPVFANQQQDLANQVAATVNGEKITVSEVDQFANTQQLYSQLYRMNSEFTQLLISSEAGKEFMNEYRKVKVKELITQKILIAEAKRRNLKFTEEEKNEIFQQNIDGVKKSNNMTDEDIKKALKQQGINSLEEYKNMFFERSGDSLLVQKLREEVYKNTEVTDQEIEEYYNQNKDTFSHPEQIKASHILISTEERTDEKAKAKAEDVMAMTSAMDFADLAKQYSDGPSGKNGGDLGYFRKGRMVKAFEEAAFNAEVGQVVGPVKTDFGYHLIKVIDKREAGSTPLSEVKDRIKSNLKKKKFRDEWTQFEEKIKKEAEFEIKL